MTAIEKLINDQLRERTKLESIHKQEIQVLYSRHEAERRSLGDSADLNQRQEQEKKMMKQKHSQQGQVLYDRHEKEHEDLRKIRKINKEIENEKITEERTALNIQRAEERERMRLAYEAEQEDRKSLFEKLKQKWQQSRDKERER